MKSTVTSAVILAAGLGSRLKERTKHQPKGFLEINGQSLIERSINLLKKKGISKIIIGTGYRSEFFDELKIQFPEIITVRNSDFAITGSMYTLYVLRNEIKEPFLLLESDLLYEPAALDHLLNDPREDIILASGTTHSGDEVFIQCSADGFLENMSKDQTKLIHVDGELTGINKLSTALLELMTVYAEEEYRVGNRALHYEDAFVGIARHKEIPVKIIQDLVWCEIDDESQLNRALDAIYPEIKRRDQ